MTTFLGNWQVDGMELVRPSGDSWDARVVGEIHCAATEEGLYAECVMAYDEDAEPGAEPVELSPCEQRQAEQGLAEHAFEEAYCAGAIPCGVYKHEVSGAQVIVRGVAKVPGLWLWLVICERPGDGRLSLHDRGLFEDGLCEEVVYKFSEG